MAYDAALDARIRLVSRWPATSSRKMFGGVCHLLAGKMFAGVWKEFLLRLGEDGAAFARELPFVRPFDITGRPMTGWVMVGPPGCRTDAQLKRWLAEARAFAGALPPRPCARSRRRGGTPCRAT